MTKRSGNVWATSKLMMTLVSPVSATMAIHGDINSSTIIVRVSDLAQVGGDTPERAKAVTEGVFSPIGISIHWLHCPGGETREDRACSTPVGPTDMSLRIFRRNQATRKKTRHSTSGITLPLAPQGGRGIIYLYFDRVLEVQNSRKLPLELVLGVIIAHEMGHVMLPGVPHALAGIMRGDLDPKDWQLATQRRLGFTDQQKEAITAGIQARGRKPNAETSTGQITSH